MIVKGGQRAKGRELAAHLLRVDTNEQVQFLGGQGVVSQDVTSALVEMEAVASGSRSQKPLYHLSVSPEADETLTQAQWRLAADRLGEALGLDGHQRVMVLHTKGGRQHAHIVWNRVDAETLKVAHHSHNYRKHEEVARSLEREFGLRRTQGIHTERDGEKPPRERPTTRESQQAARTGWTREAAQADIAAAWHSSDGGQAFRSQLNERGYALARGDRRDFVVVDPGGGIHSIRSAVKGLRAAEVRTRLGDLDSAALPSVAEARTALAERELGRGRNVEATASPPASNRPEPERQPNPLGPPAATPVPIPTTPHTALREPARYATLKVTARWTAPSTPVAKPKPPRQSAPQLVPTPPTWARETQARGNIPAAPTPSRALSTPLPPPRPGTPEPLHVRQLAESASLSTRQAATWQRMSKETEFRHQKAWAKLIEHHDRQLGAIGASYDAQIAQVSGNHGMDSGARERQLARLSSEKHESLSSERARQAEARTDLQSAQTREVADMRATHDWHNGKQKLVLAERHERQTSDERIEAAQRKPRDLDR